MLSEIGFIKEDVDFTFTFDASKQLTFVEIGSYDTELVWNNYDGWLGDRPQGEVAEACAFFEKKAIKIIQEN